MAANPFLQSGWTAGALIPNPDYHANALTYLGNTGTQSQPATASPYALPTAGQGFNFPDWLNQLLSKMGGGQGQPQIPGVAPKGGSAITQIANAPSQIPQYGTPQSGRHNPAPGRGWFAKMLGFVDPLGKKLGVTDTVGNAVQKVAEKTDPGMMAASAIGG